MGNLNINTTTNTIEAGVSGGIKLAPGATDVVEIGNGVLLPDGTKSSPAVRFSDDANTGIYSPINDVISLTGHGQDVLRLVGTLSSSNYLKVTSSLSGNPVLIEGDGSDANVSLRLLPKGSGSVEINGLSYPNTDGTANQVIATDGSGNLTFVDQTQDTGITSVVEDTSPQLGGNLDVNGNQITGTVILNGITYPSTDGTDGQVLTTDGAGNLAFQDAASGGGATGYLYTDTPATAPSGTGAGTLVIGDNAQANASSDSIVIGNDVKCDAAKAIVLGPGSLQNPKTTGTNAVAIGWRSEVTGINGTGIGAIARAFGKNSIAIGKQSTADVENAIVIGDNAFTGANGFKTIIIGTNNGQMDFGDICVGNDNTGTRGFIFGKGNTSTGLSLSVGSNCDSSAGLRSVAIGRNAVSPAGGMQIGWGLGISSSITGQPDGEMSCEGAAAQWVLPSYTVASLPTGTTGGMIFVSDETGGAVPAFYDGTNWLRMTDRAVVS